MTIYFGGTDCPACGATIATGHPCPYCECDALRASNARLREALEYYANPKNYNGFGLPVIPHEGHPGCKVPDNGRTARKALEGKP